MKTLVSLYLGENKAGNERAVIYSNLKYIKSNEGKLCLPPSTGLNERSAQRGSPAPPPHRH